MLSWKKRRAPRSLPSKPVKYPAGTFVESEKGYFYILDDHRRGRFTTKRCLDSWNPQRVVRTTEAALKNYRIALKMRFRNGSLIHSMADGKVYLISKGERRQLVSPEAFDLIGVERDRRYVTSVSLDEINLHPEGDPIS